MSIEGLSLYSTRWCFFCRRVRSAIKHLGLEVEIRDINRNPDHGRALIAARGRRTVPVLRIEQPNGEDIWLPESLDIIAYLQRHYGGARENRPAY